MHLSMPLFGCGSLLHISDIRIGLSKGRLCVCITATALPKTRTHLHLLCSELLQLPCSQDHCRKPNRRYNHVLHTATSTHCHSHIHSAKHCHTAICTATLPQGHAPAHTKSHTQRKTLPRCQMHSHVVRCTHLPTKLFQGLSAAENVVEYSGLKHSRAYTCTVSTMD